jgi:hypothetical protein
VRGPVIARPSESREPERDSAVLVAVTALGIAAVAVFLAPLGVTPGRLPLRWQQSRTPGETFPPDPP